MIHNSRAGLLSSVANPSGGRHAAPAQNTDDIDTQVEQLRRSQRETQRQSMMDLQQQYRAHIEGAVATQMQQTGDEPEEDDDGAEEEEPPPAAKHHPGGWRQARRGVIGTGRGFFMPRDAGDDGPVFWYENNSCYICRQFVPIFSQAQCCNVPAHSDCVAAFPVCYVCGRATRARPVTPPPRRRAAAKPPEPATARPAAEQCDDDGCGVRVDFAEPEASSVGSVSEQHEDETDESPKKPSSCCW